MTTRRRTGRNAEHQEQVALLYWCACVKQDYPLLRLLFAIPNGGARSARTGARLKAEGVKPGVPDLFLPVARFGFNGLFIEMKAPGELKRAAKKRRDVQAMWHDELRAQSYRVEVCEGWMAAKAVLQDYLR